MLRVEITEEMRKNARARDNGQLNEMSFMKGAGNYVGCLGEEMIKVKLGKVLLDHNTKDYDFMNADGTRFEIKSKRQNVPNDPQPNYDASVAKTSLHQQTDYYIFCRLFHDGKDFQYGWIIGYISSEDFYKKGRHLDKGDAEGHNGFKAKVDCINIRYTELIPMGK